MTYVCPVCGYDGLAEPPWHNDVPSDDISPSCGSQFGHHGVTGHHAGRERIYVRLRRDRIAKGTQWHAVGESPPARWGPVERYDLLYLAGATRPQIPSTISPPSLERVPHTPATSQGVERETPPRPVKVVSAWM